LHGTEVAIVNSDDIKGVVKEKYGQAADRVKSGGCTCCTAASAFGVEDPITKNLYTLDETAMLPREAVLASLGCGNPTALAELSPGETVLDLGSGGGIDILLSARRVGPTGKAYGLDMTDEMLSLARENQRKAGLENVEFLKGEIEKIPLPDNSVDVIISNCVINLSADKDQVLKEAFRVLKPGGRFAVSDVVVRGEVPPEVRKSIELWIGCVAGALKEEEYRTKLAAAGFESIEIEPTRIYRVDEARAFLANANLDADSIAPEVEGKFASAFIRARKPAAEETPTIAKTEDLTRYAEMFSAMGTKTRLKIMRLLLSAHPDGLVVGDIQDELGIPAATLSHHLERLKNVGLTKVRREHQFLWYSVRTEVLQELLAFLFQECCSRGKALSAADVFQKGG
jgi:arsenite methyltransferase